jgi:hypothetical protein
VIEPKDRTKDKLGRSPDDADGVNLAYYEASGLDAPVVLETARQSWDDVEKEKPRRRLFG